MIRWLPLLALTACTYPEKEFQGPFSCFGDPPPTSAAKLVMLQGQIFNPSDLMPLSGISVSLLDRNMTTISGPLATGATGGFQFSLNTNGTPVDNIYFLASGTGRVTSYLAPARPVTEDLMVPFGMISTAQRDSLALGALGMPFAANTGALFITVDDCNGKALPGATVTSTPAGVVRYFNGIQPSMTATTTDAGGVVLIANLPPGAVTARVTVDGKMLPARTFNIVADSFLQTIIQP